MVNVKDVAMYFLNKDADGNLFTKELSDFYKSE